MARKKYKAILRILIGSLMLAIGVIIALLSIGKSSQIGVLCQGIGFAFIVTGCISVFQEAILLPLRDKGEETAAMISKILKGPGIRMIVNQRKGYSGYHKWLLEKAPQKIFFAGHSVLHKVQEDFLSLGLLSVDKALKQKVSEGSNIRILFIDPTWELIEKIAKSEGQDHKSLRIDLATTLGLCRKFWEIIENEKLPGEIEIRTSKDILQQFAFHHVECKEKNQVEMLMGYYFAGKLGTKSPLFIVENEQIQEIFEEHFNAIFERSTPLLIYRGHGHREFNHNYYRNCQESLSSYLGEEKTSKLTTLGN